MVLVADMKKMIFTIILAASAAVCIAGCDDTADVHSDKPSGLDSSYYGVNYTDTGDPDNLIGNSSAKIEHSSHIKEQSALVSKTDPSSEESVISTEDKRRPKQNNSSAVSKVTTIKTTITVYYTDEAGEHSTDTDVYIDPDTDVEELSSELSSVFESRIDSDNDPNTDTEIDTDTNGVSDSEADTDSEQTEVYGSFESSDLIFIYGESNISYGDNIETVVASIGKPLHIDSIPNAENAQFDNKTYNYEYFTIETEPSYDGSVYTVCGLQVFDEDLTTEKGLKIGMSETDAVKIYGNDYLVYDDEYRYYIERQYMYLYIQNGIVANYGYGYDKNIAS